MLQKGSEALKGPTSYNNDTHERLTCAQAPNSGADCISSTESSSSTESCNEVDERLSTRRLYHQATPVTDGAAHEHKESVPFDEQCSSRSEMWDPVKDCSATPADVSGFLPTRQNSSRLATSKADVSALMGLHLPHNDQLYGQARESEQRCTSLGPRGFGLSPCHQHHDKGFGYRGYASMDLLPSPQSQAMASSYQVNASVNAQPIQVGRALDQLEHYRQHGPVYEDISTLHPRLRDRSGHTGLQSVTKGTALMGIQPRQAANLHDHAQENGEQDIDMESRTTTAVASHESMNSRQSPSSAITNMSTQKISRHQRANHHQRPSFFPDMSQATEMAQHAERLEQESNREAAIHVYKQVCTLLQDVIIRSSSLEERLECNAARNAYQARLDVLSRESPPGQNDQQDDDGPGGGKPQYSLLEDYSLCHKLQEGLSWQEVAETEIFKGKRKHRSLSQRKHTIGKMGPKYHEAEEPWTEAETRKLCALGDAGKTLGDIHRKFRSRNAERCLERYFRLRRHGAGSSQTRTSHEARHASASRPHSPEPMQDPIFIVGQSAYGVHPSASISGAGSHGQSIDAALQRTNERPTTFSQNPPCDFTMRNHTSEASCLSSPSSSESLERFRCSALFPNNGISHRLSAIRQGPSDPQRQSERQGPSYPTSPYSSALSSPQDAEHRRAFLPPPSYHPSAPGASSDNVYGRTAFHEAFRNPSAETLFPPWRRRLSMSTTSLSATTANSPTNATSPASSLSTPRMVTSPFGSRESLDDYGVAAKRARKAG